MKPKLMVRVGALVGMFLALAFIIQPVAVAADSPKIFEINNMTGVPLALTAPEDIRIDGLLGGGKPWVIGFANGALFSDGRLELKFKGLVLDPNDSGVIAAGLANMNPIPEMKVIVACYTSTGSIAQVSSELFPVTTGLASDGGGSGMIITQLSLPDPCIAPVVFITSAGGNWFAATGD